MVWKDVCKELAMMQSSLLSKGAIQSSQLPMWHGHTPVRADTGTGAEAGWQQSLAVPGISLLVAFVDV